MTGLRPLNGYIVVLAAVGVVGFSVCVNWQLSR
jgi:hypothetical protein